MLRIDNNNNIFLTRGDTLTPAKIPSNAKYVRITSTYNPNSTILSLIRTA